MIVVWGTKLYGKVDEIEGIGHVATQFGHLFWIPLIPMGSYFVTSETRYQFEGTPIGTNAKSVLAGYGRVFSVLFLLSGLGAVGALLDPHEVLEPERVRSAKIMIGLALFSIPICIASYMRSTRFADYDTAKQLAERVGLDQRMHTYIDFCYHQISEEEADRRLDSLNTATDENTEWQGDEELAAIYQRYMAG